MDLTAKTVLFVDDRPDSVAGFREAIKNKGATTKTRRSINSAIRELETKKIDLVVIDLFLPHDYSQLANYFNEVSINGNNQGELLAYYLRKQKKLIPYLFLTSQLDFYSGDQRELVFVKSSVQISPFINKIVEL